VRPKSKGQNVECDYDGDDDDWNCYYNRVYNSTSTKAQAGLGSSISKVHSVSFDATTRMTKDPV
jgi:hypothetical protein